MLGAQKARAHRADHIMSGLKQRGKKCGSSCVAAWRHSDEKWPLPLPRPPQKKRPAKMYAKESERDSAKQFPEAAFCPQPARTFSFFNLKAATTKQRTRRFLRRAFHFLRRQRRGCAGNLISHLSQVNIFPEL